MNWIHVPDEVFYLVTEEAQKIHSTAALVLGDQERCLQALQSQVPALETALAASCAASTHAGKR